MHLWVPHDLTENNKQQRVTTAQGILDALDNLGPQASRVYAVEDESWFDFFPKLPKQENKCWVGPERKRSTVVRPKLTNKKTLLLFCFTANKVYVESLPYGQTITAERYITFVQSLGEHWRKLRSDSTRLSELHYQHDNARPHTAAATSDFFIRRGVKLIRQAPYSPDFNMCDRWVFAHLKSSMKKMTFNDHVEVRKAALQVFQSVPPERFVHEMEKLKMHLRTVINNCGSYVF